MAIDTASPAVAQPDRHRCPVLREARWPVVPDPACHRTSASRVRREGRARQLRCVKLDVSRPTQPPKKQMPALMSLSIGDAGFRVVVYDTDCETSRGMDSAPFPGVTETGRFGDANADRLRADLEGGRFSEPRPAEGPSARGPASGTARSTRTKRPDSVRIAQGSPPSSRRRDRET